MPGFELRKHRVFPGRKGPLVLTVLDGVGLGSRDESDAVHLARTPTLDWLWAKGPRAALRAHGTAVGLPSDADMGNSEVGHNALGCGRVYDQGAKLVDGAIADGSLFEGKAWKEVAARRRVHFIGLLSDGNVHSHIDQLTALIRRAKQDGVERIFLHVLTDGRDVPEGSALRYVEQIERVLAEVGGRIASGGGRMITTMDRYEADWRIVERGWKAHVHGDAARFPSATAAIEAARAAQPGISDQNLPPFVVADERGEPVGRIADGDAVVFFNFRGDRAIEISRAFEGGADFEKFDRGRVPDVLYVGMMQYDGDFKIPTRFLVPPPRIARTMGEYLVRNKVPQLAISETQKYGHVTYFWNGNRGGKFDEKLETYIEIPSENLPLEERPWMKAAEITDRLVEEIASGRHRFARVNYANGDMVGHTGHRDAAITAVECVDLQLARLVRAVERAGGILIVTADHGNCDEMYEHGKKGEVVRDKLGRPIMKTSHTLNPVPFTIYDPSGRDGELRIDERLEKPGLANVTATCLELLGFERPEDEEPSLLDFG